MEGETQSNTHQAAIVEVKGKWKNSKRKMDAQNNIEEVAEDGWKDEMHNLCHFLATY